jgi:hypothetical protein
LKRCQNQPDARIFISRTVSGGIFCGDHGGNLALLRLSDGMAQYFMQFDCRPSLCSFVL